MNKIDVTIRRENYKYPVLICPTAAKNDLGVLFQRLNLYKRGGTTRRAFVLIDRGFARARPDVIKSLKALLPTKQNQYLMIAGAESSKSFGVASQILGQMVSTGLTRSDFVLAVGGGVIGDLGGFVASLYNRGIDVVHMPTTLLAMVDSSIGGKTAVNHPRGKNLIGTFHQPAAVIEVLDFVQSLPDVEFQSGLGEVFKYAVGFSSGLFRFLRANASAIHNRDAAALTHIILESAKIKAKIVGLDERETGSGSADRRLLNLGHTLGHGIEKAYRLPHGVAVAVGVTLATKLSSRVNFCSWQCYDDVMELASQLALKTEANIDWRLKTIMPYVMRDKKIVGDHVQFVALKKIGQAVVRPTRFSEFKRLEGGERE